MEKLFAILALFLLSAASPPPLKSQDTLAISATSPIDTLFFLPNLQDSSFHTRPFAMTKFMRNHLDKANEMLPWASVYLQPGVYDIWWKEIASCLKLKLPEDYKQTQFVMVNSETFIALENIPKNPEDVY